MWLILSLLSALFQILRNMVMKQIGHAMDDTINVWGRFTFILPFAGLGLLLQGVPVIKEGFWSTSVLFSLVQIMTVLCLAKALKKSDISLVTALMKLSMLFLLAWGYFTLGEVPSFLGLVGVILSAIGVYFLNVRKRQISFLAPLITLVSNPAQRWALLASMGYAPCVVLMKKMAVLSNPVFATFISYLICALLITPYTIYRSKRYFPLVINSWKPFLLMGLFAALNSLLSATAYTLTISSYVETVKQVEILFALAIGYIFFNEAATIREIWMGSVLILIGMALINLGS